MGKRNPCPGGQGRNPAELDEICGDAADEILPWVGMESNILPLAEEVGADGIGSGEVGVADGEGIGGIGCRGFGE